MSETARPTPRRAETGVDLRQAILDRARRLLVGEGYDRLSMRKIAAGVGCSATSIYLHFASKDALTHALISEGMERLHEALTAATDPDPVASLGGLSRAYVRFGLDNPEVYQILFQLHPERMERYPAEQYRRARRNIDVFAAALAEGAAQGRLRAEPTADVAANVLWTALHGLVSLLLAERIDVRLAGDAFVEAAVRQALAGVTVG
ncbi:MAG TPA: TetR/AcrR family transcriptional regulator [Rubricoccaceae bacterium]|jgi:AcrR family transcriptional regulator